MRVRCRGGSEDPPLQTRALHRRGFRDAETELGPDAIFDRLEDGGVVLEELLDVLAALAEALAAVSEPGAALLDDLPLDGEIEQVAFARDALAVHHVELRFAEGRSDLVLHHLDAGAAADDL